MIGSVPQSMFEAIERIETLEEENRQLRREIGLLMTASELEALRIRWPRLRPTACAIVMVLFNASYKMVNGGRIPHNPSIRMVPSSTLVRALPYSDEYLGGEGSVRVHIHHARRVLGPNSIVWGGQKSYYLSPWMLEEVRTALDRSQRQAA